MASRCGGLGNDIFGKNENHGEHAVFTVFVVVN